MRNLFAPVVFGACLFSQGCSFVHNIIRNTVHEPMLACDEKAIVRRNERLARQAWDEMTHQYGLGFSCDYREGFIDGFADYLTYGGCVCGALGGGRPGDQAGGCGPCAKVTGTGIGGLW